MDERLFCANTRKLVCTKISTNKEYIIAFNVQRRSLFFNKLWLFLPQTSIIFIFNNLFIDITCTFFTNLKIHFYIFISKTLLNYVILWVKRTILFYFKQKQAPTCSKQAHACLKKQAPVFSWWAFVLKQFPILKQFQNRRTPISKQECACWNKRAPDLNRQAPALVESRTGLSESAKVMSSIFWKLFGENKFVKSFSFLPANLYSIILIQ